MLSWGRVFLPISLALLSFHPHSFDSPRSTMQHSHITPLMLVFLLFFFLVIWQGDPIPEDIYEILGGSSVRSISDLQRALRIDSVGKSPLHQTLLSISLALWGEGREQSIFQQAHSQQTPLSMQ